MFAFLKTKIARLAALALVALPLGYGLLQPTEAQAARYYRGRPIYPVAPVVGVAPVVPVGPVYPNSVYGGYGWRWNGYRWMHR